MPALTLKGPPGLTARVASAPGDLESGISNRSYNHTFGRESSRSLIHLIDSPEDLEEGSYLGFLFLANFLGALAAAVGIYRGKRWGWALGFLVAGGAFAGYVISRTLGLPGLPVETEWLEPLGVLSLIVEGMFVGLCLAILARPNEEIRVVGADSSAQDVQQGGRS